MRMQKGICQYTLHNGIHFFRIFGSALSNIVMFVFLYDHVINDKLGTVKF